jgi:hypothetical protein
MVDFKKLRNKNMSTQTQGRRQTKGLQTRGDSGIVYLVIKHGSLCQESKKPVEGYTPVKVTNPQTNEELTKYVKRYSSVEGYVTKLEWYSREHEGRKYNGFKVSLNANNSPVVLDLVYNTAPFNRFLKCAENLDFTQPVEFSAWSTPEGIAFTMRQNDINVPQKYTRDNPGDCPEPVQDEITGKWDYSQQTRWLWNRVMKKVIPAVAAADNPEAASAPKQQEKTEDNGEDDGEELPKFSGPPAKPAQRANNNPQTGALFSKSKAAGAASGRGKKKEVPQETYNGESDDPNFDDEPSPFRGEIPENTASNDDDDIPF